MGFTCGIVGLPNVGKSTLFNAITTAGAAVANYPFCTIDPNVGVVAVPDERLDRLADMYKPEKKIPTTLEFHDIAGLVKGASKGEGLGNQFLSHIRTVDAIAHVVRCFDDENIVHVNGKVDPQYDIEVVETELMLKDLETLEKKIADADKRKKSGDKKSASEMEFYINLQTHISSGRMAGVYRVQTEDEKFWLRDVHLLTNKPVMYICNVLESELTTMNSRVKVVHEIAAKKNAGVVVVSAAVEAEIAELPESERAEFLSGLGLNESGLNRVIRQGYDLLQLITFFTVGSKEVHAWTVPRDTTAVRASGEIHSDFERGFIRAEIMKFSDIDRLHSELAVKEAGLLHVEGKEYKMKDGDVLFVRFNV